MIKRGLSFNDKYPFVLKSCKLDKLKTQCCVTNEGNKKTVYGFLLFAKFRDCCRKVSLNVSMGYPHSLLKFIASGLTITQNQPHASHPNHWMEKMLKYIKNDPFEFADMVAGEMRPLTAK